MPARGAAGLAFLSLLLLAGAARAAESRLAGELDAEGFRQLLLREKGRVVLVNFWATWCVPCREEFPELARLQRSYGGKGLTVLGVSTDLAGDVPAVEKFLAAQRPGFANYRKRSGGDDQDFIEAVDSSWGGELPFSVLYARDGRKAAVLSAKRSFTEYERRIVPLLKSRS